jgi:restriction endonuclease S subunit
LKDLATPCVKPGIRKSDVEKLKIPVPSLDTQQKCIDVFQSKDNYLSEIDTKIEKEKQYIEDLRNLGKDVISHFCS